MRRSDPKQQSPEPLLRFGDSKNQDRPNKKTPTRTGQLGSPSLSFPFVLGGGVIKRGGRISHSVSKKMSGSPLLPCPERFVPSIENLKEPLKARRLEKAAKGHCGHGRACSQAAQKELAVSATGPHRPTELGGGSTGEARAPFWSGF